MKTRKTMTSYLCMSRINTGCHIYNINILDDDGDAYFI